MPGGSSMESRKKWLKKALNHFILPEKVVPRVADLGGGRPDRSVLEQAVANVCAKIEQIVNSMPRVNDDTVLLKIPSLDYLELMLRSEYFYVNSLIGEQATIRYLKRARKGEDASMTRFLEKCDVTSQEDLSRLDQVTDRKSRAEN